MNSLGELYPCKQPLDHAPRTDSTTYRHVVGVDVVRALLVVHRLQLEARVVVGQDVGESVLGSVAGQVGERAGLVPTHVLQLLELFAEAEVRVGGHQPVVVGEVLDSDGARGLDDGVGEGHVVIGPGVGGLAGGAPPPDVDDDEEEDGEEDQRDEHAEYYVGVVLV